MSDLPPPPPPPIPPPSYGSGGGGQVPPVGELLTKGWGALMSRFVDFLVVAVVAGVISGLINFIFVRDEPTTGGFFIVWLFSLVIGVLVSLVFTRLSLAAADTDSRSLGALVSDAMSKLAPYIGWTILASLIISIGLVLCFLPGIVAAFFLMFVPFLALAGPPGVNPLVGSFNAVKEQAGNLILLFLVFLGIFVVAVVASFVLGFIPLIGQIAGQIITFGVLAFALTTLAVTYRSSAVGRA